MSVGRICVREVDTVDPEETVQAAAERMHSRNVGSLIVISKGREPIGILTDRDVTVKVVARGRDPLTTYVDEVMGERPKCVREDASIESALAVMRSGPFRRVPVVADDGKLVGLVTLDDVLDLLAEEFGAIGALLREENPRALAKT
ncbi:MAG: CBS domain-containing protein [Pirellulaceae bacterium]